MSSIIRDAIIARSSQRNLDTTNNISSLDQNTIALNKIANNAPIPYTFIQSFNNTLSSNVADGIMIIQSPVMGHGQRGVIEDLNVNFTTVAGTVRIVKVRGQDALILVDIVRGITASTSGSGSVVIEEGEAIAIVGQVAGVGTFGVFFSGKIFRTEA